MSPLVPFSYPTRKRERSFLESGFENTTLGLTESSLVPIPNMLSVRLEIGSVFDARLGAGLVQSVWPLQLGSRFPSEPSKVLPLRVALEQPTGVGVGDPWAPKVGAARLNIRNVARMATTAPSR